MCSIHAIHDAIQMLTSSDCFSPSAFLLCQWTEIMMNRIEGLKPMLTLLKLTGSRPGCVLSSARNAANVNKIAGRKMPLCKRERQRRYADKEINATGCLFRSSRLITLLKNKIQRGKNGRHGTTQRSLLKRASDAKRNCNGNQRHVNTKRIG